MMCLIPRLKYSLAAVGRMLVDIHAAITMRFTAKASKAPCNCEAQKHAKHTEPAITLQTTPSPARTRLTHEVPFIAGCSHFTRKNTFRAPASSPKQTPCNIHAAITTRFATKASKAPCNCEAQKRTKHIEPALPFHRRLQPLYSFLPKTSPMQHSCSHYHAFCSTTHTFMQPVHCDWHPHVAKHQGRTDYALKRSKPHLHAAFALTAAPARAVRALERARAFGPAAGVLGFPHVARGLPARGSPPEHLSRSVPRPR